MEHNVMDNTELLKLSLSKGGIGNATFDYNESPSTQTYTQNASQQLNAGYNQMLADIHRMGDINNAKFNMDMKALNAGLENKYKEELRDKEFNNELKKLQYTHDLAMKKYERARQDQLADRDFAINYNEQEKEKDYRRNLPYFMDTGRNKPIVRQNILQDPNTGKFSLYKSNTFPIYELPQELQELYYDFNKLNNRNSINEFDTLLTNDFKNYLVNRFDTLNDKQKLAAYLNYIDKANQKYRKNLPERPYTQYIHYGDDVNDPTRNLNSFDNPEIKYLGGGKDGNPMSSFMFGLFKSGNLPAQNFIKQNGLMIAGHNQKENIDANELADIINTTPPKVLNELYGFVNNHGMDDKIILTNPNNPQKYYIYEKSSNNVYSFYISHYTEDGKPYFEPLGPISFQSLDKNKNNYEDKGLLYNLENAIDDSMYNAGAYIRKLATDAEGKKKAEPNPNNALFRMNDKEYKFKNLINLFKNKTTSE